MDQQAGAAHQVGLTSFARLACVFAVNNGMKAAAMDASSGAPFASARASASLGERIIDEARMGIMLQPKLGLRDMRVCGFEAFASPELDGSKLSASVFVPSIEMARMQSRFDWRVLEAGFALAGACRASGSAPISFNVSPVTLCEEGFARRLAELASERLVDLAGVKIEVLEKMPLSPAQQGQMRAEMESAKATGFHFSIDDFGTFDANCAMLDLPAGELKIDAFYVRMLGTRTARRWVSSMIDLAKEKGMSVCAEGVEHEWQARALAGMGVDVGQGYLWAKSMEAADALGMMDRPVAPRAMDRRMAPRSHDAPAATPPSLAERLGARRKSIGALAKPGASPATP